VWFFFAASFLLNFWQLFGALLFNHSVPPVGEAFPMAKHDKAKASPQY
jgi:hypothetical protein